MPDGKRKKADPKVGFFAALARLLLLGRSGGFSGLGFSGGSSSSAFSGLGSFSSRSGGFSGLGSFSGRSGGSGSGDRSSGFFFLTTSGNSQGNQSSNEERVLHCLFPINKYVIQTNPELASQGGRPVENYSIKIRPRKSRNAIPMVMAFQSPREVPEMGEHPLSSMSS